MALVTLSKVEGAGGAKVTEPPGRLVMEKEITKTTNLNVASLPTNGIESKVSVMS